MHCVHQPQRRQIATHLQPLQVALSQEVANLLEVVGEVLLARDADDGTHAIVLRDLRNRLRARHGDVPDGATKIEVLLDEHRSKASGEVLRQHLPIARDGRGNNTRPAGHRAYVLSERQRLVDAETEIAHRRCGFDSSAADQYVR